MRRTFASAGLLCIALALLHPANSRASYIGVFFDAAGSDCDATQPSFTPLYWYVIAKLFGDAAAPGIRGAAFRITGVPANWFHIVTANPNNIYDPPLGNMLQEGTQIAFPECTAGQTGMVLLFTVQSFSISQIDNLRYRPEAPQLPSYTGYDSPVLVLCDEPVFSQLCVQGSAGFVNSSIPCNADFKSTGGVCPPVAVAPHTWGGVKTLYRD